MHLTSQKHNLAKFLSKPPTPVLVFKYYFFGRKYARPRFFWTQENCVQMKLQNERVSKKGEIIPELSADPHRSWVKTSEVPWPPWRSFCSFWRNFFQITPSKKAASHSKFLVCGGFTWGKKTNTPSFPLFTRIFFKIFCTKWFFLVHKQIKLPAMKPPCCFFLRKMPCLTLFGVPRYPSPIPHPRVPRVARLKKKPA